MLSGRARPGVGRWPTGHLNTDQGAQFTSDAFTSLLRVAGVQISMDGRGRAIDNVFVERLIVQMISGRPGYPAVARSRYGVVLAVGPFEPRPSGRLWAKLPRYRSTPFIAARRVLARPASARVDTIRSSGGRPRDH